MVSYMLLRLPFVNHYSMKIVRDTSTYNSMASQFTLFHNLTAYCLMAH
jgi:hypothetical protein